MDMNQERITGPEIKPIQQVQLPQIDQVYLSNGIPVYAIGGSTQQVIKLEVIIAAGRPYEHVRTAARTISSLLKEGTTSRTGEKIANQLEFYGITFNTSCDIDHIKISTYSLSKYFEQAVDIVTDVMMHCTFPEDELKQFQSNVKQRLEIDLIKNDVLAYRALTGSLYGENHPYGYNSTIENYNAITRELLQEEYASTFGANRCTIFLSGRIDDKVIAVLDKAFAQFNKEASRPIKVLDGKIPPTTQITIDSPNPYQSAIRYGKRLFNRKHEDYAGLSVLSTVLGGYFGSRLMSNIREDKGYTYNIYSGIDTMVHDGYFYISTEVGTEYLEDTQRQIKHEIEVLQNDLVPQTELSMVKNYIAGNYLNMLDGPLKSSRVVRNIVCSNLELSSFDSIISKTLNITAQEIRDLAVKHLVFSDMTKVVV